MNLELKYLKQTCSACPSQWEAVTKNLKPVYIRYRWGYLTVEIGNYVYRNLSQAMKDDISSRALNTATEYSFQECVGGEYDGCMSESDMLKYTGLYMGGM